MNPKIDVITLGVEDLERAREFYEQGLGGAVRDEHDRITVRLGAGASPLALRPWDAVAREAAVEAQTSGFRAFTLSYILDSAESVDAILARAERHGGEVSKPPKNALWGYSAYVTDPSGYLWKIASSKRGPLIARKDPAMENGRPIEPQEVPITIGVADMKRAKNFYETGLGLPVKKDYRKFVMFRGEDGTSDLGMYKREALAEDAATDPAGSGFRGFSITHIVESPERVDALLARAARAGGTIVRRGLAAGGGEYSGYFADPDGNLWQVSTGADER
jgi:catechol 2,3-dioxygenase-like lactoylglutathione lyase family enzyme